MASLFHLGVEGASLKKNISIVSLFGSRYGLLSSLVLRNVSDKYEHSVLAGVFKNKITLLELFCVDICCRLSAVNSNDASNMT